MKLARQAMLLWLLITSCVSAAQRDSCQLQISLLTCSPGAALYSTFGHTALRVSDTSTGLDMVFNYGTFDDSDAWAFYMNFTRGLMRYALSAYAFEDFMEEYTSAGRGVTGQLLNLSCVEKERLFTALQTNLREDKRFYYYYFHKDNCTTRARDMITLNTSAHVAFSASLPDKNTTYRSLIYEYLDKGHQPWSKFGIDVLLGSNVDKKINGQEATFLPDYLMKAADSARAGNTVLLEDKRVLFAAEPLARTGSWFGPFILFSVLFVVVGLLSFLKPAAALLRVFDVTFFMLLGLTGWLLLVLWLIRVDDVCRNNWNLLWALPTHLPVAFVVTRSKKWVQVYFKSVAIFSILLLCCWYFLPQQFNTAFLPVLGLILVRSFQLAKK